MAFDLKNKINKATAHFSQALRIKPEHTDAHNNLKKALTLWKK